jgi:hypothetical protein
VTLDSRALLSALKSDAMELGVLRKVTGHEPRNAPGKGLHLSYWMDRIRPARSGLASTSALVVVNARLQSSLLAERQDDIDPDLTRAADLLIGRYIRGFTLGGKVRSVDVRGMEGISLEGRYGYIEQDRKEFRTFTLTVPLIINDVWPESP